MRRSTWLLVSALAVLTGCARSTTTVYTLPSTGGAAASWMGRSVAEVLEVWGKPAKEEPDGEGGRLITYREDSVVSVQYSRRDPTAPDRMETGTDVQGPSRRPAGLPAESAASAQAKDVARFWIDAEGTVYRYWFSPGVYRKEGAFAPPPAGAPPSEDP